MDGRGAKTCGVGAGMFAAAVATFALADAPDRLDTSFAADEVTRRPYVTGLVASSLSGQADAAGIASAPFGGDGALGVAVPQAAGDLRLEIEARLPRDDGGWTTAANAWRDLRLRDRLGVYAGGGLGMGAGPDASGGGTGLAWQAGAGATYALTPRVTLDVGYRLHGLEAPRTATRGDGAVGEVVMSVRVFEPLRGWLR